MWIAAVGAVVLSTPQMLLAEEFPQRPIRIVVPFAAGSGSDVTIRFLTQNISESTGWQFIVDNRSGANGFIGAETVAKAKGDGYTLLFSGNTTHAANSALFLRLPYDPIDDFIPITRTAFNPLLLVVSPKHDVSTVGELTTLIKRNPGRFSFGVGSATHRLAGELYKNAAGLDVVNINYRGGAQVLTDLIAGHIDFMFIDAAAGMPYVRSGGLRALAVTTTRRVDILPEMPTMVESGFPEFDVTVWSVLFAPRDTPDSVVKKLHLAFSTCLKSERAKDYYRQNGSYPDPTEPEETQRWIKAEIERYRAIFARAGIKPQ